MGLGQGLMETAWATWRNPAQILRWSHGRLTRLDVAKTSWEVMGVLF